MKQDKLSFSRNGDDIKINYFSLFDAETMEYDHASMNFNYGDFLSELDKYEEFGQFSLANKKQDKLKMSKASGEPTIVLEQNNQSFVIKGNELDIEKIKEAVDYGV